MLWLSGPWSCFFLSDDCRLPAPSLCRLAPGLGELGGGGDTGPRCSCPADSWPAAGLVAAHPPATAQGAQEQRRSGGATPGRVGGGLLTPPAPVCADSSPPPPPPRLPGFSHLWSAAVQGCHLESSRSKRFSRVKLRAVLCSMEGRDRRAAGSVPCRTRTGPPSDASRRLSLSSCLSEQVVGVPVLVLGSPALTSQWPQSTGVGVTERLPSVCTGESMVDTAFGTICGCRQALGTLDRVPTDKRTRL